MDTKIFEYLLAVERHRSITRAAEEHLISQPTLSQHLRNVERKYNLRIFKKSKNGLLPTEDGKILLSGFRQMLQTEREMQESFQNMRKPTATLLRIFTDFQLRERFLEVVWPAFHAKFPRVELSMICGDASVGIHLLREQQVDAALLSWRGDFPGSIGSIPVASDEMLLVMPAKHPDILAYDRIHYEMLADDLFFISQYQAFYSNLQARLLQLIGIQKSAICHLELMQEMYDRVAQGDGCSVLPASLIRSKSDSDSVRVLSFDPPETYHLILAYHRSHYINNYLQTLFALAKQYFMNPNVS